MELSHWAREQNTIWLVSKFLQEKESGILSNASRILAGVEELFALVNNILIQLFKMQCVSPVSDHS